MVARAVRIWLRVGTEMVWAYGHVPTGVCWDLGLRPGSRKALLLTTYCLSTTTYYLAAPRVVAPAVGRPYSLLRTALVLTIWRRLGLSPRQ